MEQETQAQAILDLDKKSPLTMRGQLLLSNFWFALNFQSGAFLPIVVTTQVLLFVSDSGKVVLLGALSALGTIAGLLTQPLVGALSDRTWLAYGRRRPYILLGAILTLIGMLLMAQTASLLVFVLAFLLVQIATNGSTAAYQSLLPDRVPPEQRGTASGYMGLMSLIGTFGSLAAAGYLFSDFAPGPNANGEIMDDSSAFYLLSGILILVTALITVIGVSEARAAPARRTANQQPRHLERRRSQFLRLWLEPLRQQNFRWVFLTRFSLMMGLWLFETFIEYYLDDVLHLTNFIQATSILAGLALIGALASAIVAGWLSDRVGRVRIVFVASGLMTLAAATFVIAPAAFILWPMAVVFGLGYGAYFSVDWALAVDTLPSLQAAGKDMGIWSVASNLPTVIAPVIGSAMIVALTAFNETALGYRLVFAVAALAFIIATVFIVKVRIPHLTNSTQAV
ncbi:MAG TPA: MFS transporter [Ktedonobacterales bacterium]|jgi:MFS family permease